MPCWLIRKDNIENVNDSETVVKEDLEFGTKVEPAVIKKLERFFNEPIKQMPEGSYYDAESDTARYEIKTRRFPFATHETTYIPNSKFFSKIQGKELRFVFNFTDGMYFIDYNQNTFEKYEEDLIEADRCRGGVYKKTKELHTLISVADLTTICVTD